MEATFARDDLAKRVAIKRREGFVSVGPSRGSFQSNDLTDIFYLVQACGYADAAVGERGFVTLVQQAQRRLGRPVTAHKTLRALRDSGVLSEAQPRPPVPPQRLRGI